MRTFYIIRKDKVNGQEQVVDQILTESIFLAKKRFRERPNYNKEFSYELVEQEKDKLIVIEEKECYF